MFDYINTKYEDAQIVINDLKTANEAINLIKNKIKENGKNAELLCYLSKACIFTKKTKLALKYAKEACKLASDYNYAKSRVIFAYYKLKNQKKALSLIDELLKVKNLDTFSAYLALISIDDLNNEKINKLAEIINRDETLNNNIYDYTIRIITYCLNKEFEKAEIYIKEANEKQFLDSRICDYLSYLYYHNKDYNNSLKYAEKGIELNPNSSYCYYIKGSAFWNLNDKEETIKALLKAEELGCTYNNLFQLIADTYLFMKDKKNAIKYINKAIKSAPDNAFNYNAKGIILSAFDNKKEAIKYFNKAIKLDNKALYIYKKGCALYWLNENEKSLKELTKAESMGYSKNDLFSKLSYLYFKKNDYKKSLEYANKAILQDSNDEYLYYRKGFALYNLKEYEKAEKAFLNAEELKCDFDDMYSRLSYIYCKKEEYNKALNYANKAILLNNKDNFSHYRKGVALIFLGKIEEAEISFQKSEELGGSYEDMYFGISISRYIKNDFESALRYINKALLKNNKNGENFYVKAQILSNLGKEFKAQKCYKQAMKLGYNN